MVTERIVMTVGVSSACFFPCDTLQSVQKLASLGVEYTEIFMGSHSECSGQYLKQLCSAKDNYGISVTSVHPFTSGYEYILLFSGYERRIDDTVEYYKRYFSAAGELGAKYVVFHGDNKKAAFVGVERYAEIFSRLDGVARSFGVRLSQENVSSSHIGSGENIRALKALLPDICFTFDIKQAYRGGYDPFDILHSMGQSVRCVHLNDWKDGQCRLPCRGVCDLSAVVNTVQSYGNDVPYIIEVYRSNFEDDREIMYSRLDFLKLFSKE